MEHAQQHGLRCHRDIKPENLMVSSHTLPIENGHVFSSRLRIIRLSDFGLAKSIGPSSAAVLGTARLTEAQCHSLCLTDNFCGTPPYMPPEQYFDAAHADVRSDLYAFGIVLSELQTGRHPLLPRCISSDALSAWRDAHVLQKPERFEGPLWPLVEKCLEKDAERRFQSIQELRCELDSLDAALGEPWDWPYPL
jgi:serine/threonine-protein kinase